MNRRLVNVGDQVQPSIQVSDKLGVEYLWCVPAASSRCIIVSRRFMPVNYTSIIRNLRACDSFESGRPFRITSLYFSVFSW